MNGNKSPLEKSISEAISIYKNRLGIYFASIIISLSIIIVVAAWIIIGKSWIGWISLLIIFSYIESLIKYIASKLSPSNILFSLHSVDLSALPTRPKKVLIRQEQSESKAEMYAKLILKQDIEKKIKDTEFYLEFKKIEAEQRLYRFFTLCFQIQESIYLSEKYLRSLSLFVQVTKSTISNWKLLEIIKAILSIFLREELDLYNDDILFKTEIFLLQINQIVILSSHPKKIVDKSLLKNNIRNIEEFIKILPLKSDLRREIQSLIDEIYLIF